MRSDRRFTIIVNGRLALFDRSIDPDNPRNPQDLAWRIEGMELRHSAHDGWWDVETSIPLAALGVAAADFGTPWGIRICRNWRRPGEQSQWETTAPSYEDQPSMPVVTWDAAAPVVQVLRLQEDWRQARIAVAVRNPHTTPLRVRVHLADAWHFNPPSEREATLTVPPGGMEEAVLEAPDGGPAGVHRTAIRVASADDATTYYQREVRWSLHRPPPVERWSIGEESRKAVGLGFKYYPYHNRIRLRVDLTNLPLRDRITGGQAEIRSQAAPADEPLWRQTLAFREAVAEGTYAIPDLPDGTYRLDVRLAGEDAPREPVSEGFERRHYEWEHNRLGLSDEVMPPFTPMAVRDTTVSCVLREHRHGATGLWDSLVSEGHELLAAPLRWEVETAAGVATVEGAGWHATRQTPTGVAGEARWQAGGLKAVTRTEYDVDGMMRVTLALDAAPATDVRRLSLVIPLRDDECRYLHGCGDGLRHNAAGFVPAGEGVVWDSSKGNKLEIPGTFYPYLWLGGGTRGLCCLPTPTTTGALTKIAHNSCSAAKGLTPLSPIHAPGRPDRPRAWLGSGVPQALPGGLAALARRQAGSAVSGFLTLGAFTRLPPREALSSMTTAKARQTSTTTPSSSNADQARDATRTMASPQRSWLPGFYRAHINAGFPTSQCGRPGLRLFGYTTRGSASAPEFRTFQDEWLRCIFQFRPLLDPRATWAMTSARRPASLTMPCGTTARCSRPGLTGSTGTTPS